MAAMNDSSLTERCMARLWDRMAAIYGHRWISSYGTCTSTAFGVWTTGLEGLTPEQIGIGLNSCMSRRDIKDVDRIDPWPPTLPEFRALCLPTPEQAGLPSEDVAYMAACNCDWSLHPVVWVAALKVGRTRLKQSRENKTRKLFAKEYRKLIDRVMGGEVFTMPEPAGPAVTVQRTSRERAALEIAKLRQAIAA